MMNKFMHNFAQLGNFHELSYLLEGHMIERLPTKLLFFLKLA